MVASLPGVKIAGDRHRCWKCRLDGMTGNKNPPRKLQATKRRGPCCCKKYINLRQRQALYYQPNH